MGRQCSIEGCGRPHYGRGWCRVHWQRANKERRSQQQRRYYQEHKEQVLEGNRQWRARNPDKVKEASRRYSQANKARLEEYNKAWRAENRDRFNEQARTRRRIKDHGSPDLVGVPAVCVICDSAFRKIGTNLTCSKECRDTRDTLQRMQVGGVRVGAQDFTPQQVQWLLILKELRRLKYDAYYE
jgi:DNA-binding transcriptional MerR regulator